MKHEKSRIDIQGFIKRNRAAREKYLRRLFKNRKEDMIKIKILFIAESPPYPTDGEEYFWRIKTGEKPGYLLKYLLTAIYGEKVANLEAQPFLEQFVDDGYFLIDASEEPVNQLDGRRDRSIAIEKNNSYLPAEVQKLDPQYIVIIKRTIYKLVRRTLLSTQYDKRILGDKGLPFPNNGHQWIFVEELRELQGSLMRPVQCKKFDLS